MHLANALAGKARQAADYAAYAPVNGQGGYAAVAHSVKLASAPACEWHVNVPSQQLVAQCTPATK